MKLTRDQLLQQNLKVFLQKPGQTRPYRVMFPESVDTETGTVELWVIPTEPTQELLKKEPITAKKMAQKPPEVDDLAVLKSAQGKVLILDANNKIIAEGP